MIGSYEILSAIGAGGMGDVYRARDGNLRRDVAIKVLSEAFAADSDRLSRFEREAHVLASLNHPNIAAIYGLERTADRPFLIMELVPGRTLADRLAQGSLPPAEALPLAAQIAAALEAAHEGGVVHRDLKPANVIITPEGRIKVLAFGLARRFKGAAGAMAGPDLSNSPTMRAGQTSMGLILGTAAYMSPEQARGNPVDKRTDIWSFGCVLYEMLAGAPAFAGDTLTDILAAVVHAEPAWSALPASTPATMRALLRRCLKKDPGARLHDIADARIELEEAIAAPDVPHLETLMSQAQASYTRLIPWAAIVLLALALLVSQFGPRVVEPLPAAVTRLALNMPAGVETGMTATPSLSLSPDGTRVAFIGGTGGLRRLYIRRFDQFEATSLRGTETANVCVFSPDGNAVAFIASDRTLKIVALGDGLVTSLTGDVDYSAGGLTWAPDGTIVFARAQALWRVNATGGTPQRLTTLDDARRERVHLWPTAVGDSQFILFASVSGADQLSMLSLATGERRVVLEDGSNPVYSASGHLLFSRNGAILATPFDAKTLKVTGPLVAVLDGVSLDQLGNPLLALSAAGAFAYVAGDNSTKRLVWVAREGIEQSITDTDQPYVNPRLGPDANRIVVEVAGGGLWVHDLSRATFTRLTTGATIGNTFGVWTPDGSRVVFRTVAGLYQIDTDGGGRLQAIPNTSVADIPSSVSADGKTLAFIRQTPGGSGRHLLALARWRPAASPCGEDQWIRRRRTVLTGWTVDGVRHERGRTVRRLCAAVPWTREETAGLDQRRHPPEMEPQRQGALLPERQQDDGRRRVDEPGPEALSATGPLRAAICLWQRADGCDL